MTPPIKVRAQLKRPKPFERQVVLSFEGTQPQADIILSASQSAMLMFEIGHALEEVERLAKGPSADRRLSLKFPAHDPRR